MKKLFHEVTNQFISEEEKTWIEAQNSCRSKNKSSIHTLTINDLDLVADVKNITLWTGMKKHIFTDWKGKKSNVTGYNINRLAFIIYNLYGKYKT